MRLIAFEAFNRVESGLPTVAEAFGGVQQPAGQLVLDLFLDVFLPPPGVFPPAVEQAELDPDKIGNGPVRWPSMRSLYWRRVKMRVRTDRTKFTMAMARDMMMPLRSP